MPGERSAVARIAGVVAGGVLLVSPAAVSAESRLELATSLRVSASDNPLLIVGPAQSALLAEATVNPSWELREGTATTRLAGTLTVRRYSRAYDKYTYGSASLDREGRLSEALSYTGGLSYDRSVTVDVIDDVAAAVDPTSLRNKAAAEASIRWRPGQRGEWNSNLAYQRIWFDGTAALRNYQSLDLSLGYFHSLSEATRIGAQASARFNRSRTSDINVYGVMTRLEHRFGPAWTLAAGVGAERVEPVGRAAGAVGGTFVSGEAELCRRGAYLTLCGSAALASQPTGLGVVQRRLSLETKVDYRLSERTDLTLSGSFERPIGSGAGVAGTTNARYLQLRAEIGRRVSETLTVRAHSSYRRREAALGKADAGYVGVELRWTPRLS